MGFSNCGKRCRESVFMVYFAIQLASMLTLYFLNAPIAVHLLAAFCTVTFYFAVSFKDPGYYDGDAKSHQSSEEHNSQDPDGFPAAIKFNPNRKNQFGSSPCVKISDSKPFQSSANGRGAKIKIVTKPVQVTVPKQNSKGAQLEKAIARDQDIQSYIQQGDLRNINFTTPHQSPETISEYRNKTQPDAHIASIKAHPSEKQGSNCSRVIVKELEMVVRYCRLCHHNQPLRVRHCIECQRCVSCFDHHCPWMNNCIGEKNRGIFLFYLVSQIMQIVLAMVEIIQMVINSFNVAGGHHMHHYGSHFQTPLILFAFCLLCFGVITLLLFIFQLYFISNNLTTWEYMRWDKIDYLQIFDRTKIKSIFTKGFGGNWKIFWKNSFRKECRVWENQISSKAALCVIIKPDMERAKQALGKPQQTNQETERKLAVKSDANVK